VLYINPYASDPALMHGHADPSKREEVALEQFERQFLRELMKSMRKMVPEGKLFPDSQQKQWFDEMLDDQMAGAMAKSGQLGVANQLREQLDSRRGENSAPEKPVGGLPLHTVKQGMALQGTAAPLPLKVQETGGIAWQAASEGFSARLR